MSLIDTIVFSEARKGDRANAGVSKFWQRSREETRFLPVQAVGGLRQGLEMIRRRGDLSQGLLLDGWLGTRARDFGDRILAFDADSSQVWGKRMSLSSHNPVDRQIASLALISDLTVRTRDIANFEGTGVRLLNPFV